MAHAGMFPGRRIHGVICVVDSKLLQEAPEGFAQAVPAVADQAGISNTPFGSPAAFS
jgi:hypothetical protein